METRKLIKFGKNSYVITLPQEWVLKNKLQKGNSLFIRQSPEGILISPSTEQTPEERKWFIDANRKDKYDIQRDIVTAYVNNSKIIELRGTGVLNHGEELTRFLKNFMSLEILEQTTDKIVVKDFLNFEDISLDSIAKRVDNIVRVMIEDCFRALDEDLADNLQQRDSLINRFYFLSYRIIRSGLSDVTVRNRLGMSSVSLLEHWQLMQSLESIGDQCKNIARDFYALQLRKKEKREEVLALFKEIQELYCDVLKAYYAKNKEAAHTIRERSKVLVAKIDRYLEKNRESRIPFLASSMKYFVFNIKDISREVLRRA